MRASGPRYNRQLKRYRAYLFDLDGTIYRGGEVLPGAIDAVAALRARGALVRFLTNNSSQTRDYFAAKLARMGIEAAPEEIATSATGAARYLVVVGATSTYVVGMPGLVRTLGEGGVAVVNAGPEECVLPSGVQADACVVGICQDLSYGLIEGAMSQIRAGARFVATNPDPTFPLEAGRLAPGAGAMVAAVQACAEVEPVVIGKPNPFLIEMLLERDGLAPSEALVVGDRMDTDVEAGRRAGCDTLLLLTGVETQAPSGQPYLPDLRAFARRF